MLLDTYDLWHSLHTSCWMCGVLSGASLCNHTIEVWRLILTLAQSATLIMKVVIKLHVHVHVASTLAETEELPTGP